MKFLDRLARIPGALVIVPLLVGATLGTIDGLHVPAIERALAALGVPPGQPHAGGGEGHRALLGLGGFTTALTGPGATTLIACFLVCVAAQMDFDVGRRALRKGLVITLSKWMVGLALGYGLCRLGDGFEGPLGLTLVAILAAATNGNGGLYLALSSRFGDRSDVGAISVISLNDGPFLTLVGLGVLGSSFPAAAFVSVLLPLGVGFLLGRWDPRVRAFLAAGERLLIPFFAFALGTTLTFAVLAEPRALAGGICLGVLTVVLTGLGATLALRLIGERSLAGWAEASTAGNAVQTPASVAIVAASLAPGSPEALRFAAAVPLATAQVSVAVLVTALLCPWIVSRLARRHVRATAPELAATTAPHGAAGSDTMMR